ncbi:hypothetical protein [Agathobaculum sp. Marseille-P7918]|uniref:hypothetical protein n=1 Tax=Agathobaculum sp. Marseille-P7918 TaxID=2479843 RepID=UPI000F6317E1|nr:hypothetical protein [Agathobaculum sp. Marseille-P7918]
MSIIISKNGFSQKPSSNNERRMHRMCENLQLYHGNIQEIATKISQGYTIYTNVLNLNATDSQTVNSSKFQESEWIGLDFDNAFSQNESIQAQNYLTMQDCIEKMKKAGLYPTIVYPTFSFTQEHHKFRVLFHLNETIPKDRQRKLCILIDMLMTLFPTCDKQCKDFARMFFGTNQPIDTFYIDENATLDEQTLWQHYVCLVTNSRLTSTDQTKKWKSIAKKWAVKIIGTPQMPNVITKEFCPVIDFEFIDGYAEKSFAIAKSYRRQTQNNDTEMLTLLNAIDNVSNEISVVSNRSTRINNIPRSNSEVPHPKRIRNWEKKLFWMSKLFNAFVEGTKVLNYQERFFFVTNLRFIEGGISYFLHHIKENIVLYGHDYDYYKNQTHNMMRYAHYKCSVSYLQNENLYPYNDYLAFCGYTNIFDALQQRVVFPARITETDKIPLAKAFNKLTTYFQKALSSPSKDVYAIHAGVGVGKTEVYTCADYSRYRKVLLCVPTHDLACEIELRLRNAGQSDVIRIKRRPSLSNPEEEAQYQKYLKAGLTKQAHNFYAQCCASHTDQPIGLDEYQRSLYDSSHAHIVICTHAFLSIAAEPTNYDLVVIDEDIKSTYLGIKTCPYNVLMKFYSSLVLPEKQNKYQPLLTQLRHAYDEISNGSNCSYVYSEPVSTVETLSELSEDDFDITLFNSSATNETKYENAAYFSQSSAFTISSDADKLVSFVNKLPYKPICKTIILSATMDKLITKKIFEPRPCHWFAVPEICNQQNIIQDITYSCSATFLDEHFDDLVDYIKSTVPDYATYTVLTFKKYVERFIAAGFHAEQNSEGNYYAFGNLDGVDTLNGKNLLVIGKLSFPEPIYKLMAKALGLPFSSNIQHRHYQEIEDYTTSFFSFSDENLRTLQINTIHSSIVQAAGRARTARTNAKVWIFSDVPTPIADEVRYMNIPIIQQDSNKQIKQYFLAS